MYTLSLGTIVGFMRIPKSVLCYKYGNFLLMKICFVFLTRSVVNIPCTRNVEAERL